MDIDIDAGAGRGDDPLSLLIAQDLDPLSLDELTARIAVLSREIERCQRHRDRASAHRSSAEALFSKS
jgi:uncharacterized small protein (DUF1192 family)